MDADASLAASLECLLPCLKNEPTGGALFEALLRCCKQFRITGEAELLLWLTSDSPFVQRRLLLAMAERHREDIPCHLETVQHLVERIVQALSVQHLSQLQRGPTGTAGHREDAISSISQSMASLLGPGTAEKCTSSPSFPPTTGAISGASRRRPLFFTTGCPYLDKLFGGSSGGPEAGAYEGGFRAGLLTEVYGEAGSGKTQLVLQSLLQCVAHHLSSLRDPTWVAECCTTQPSMGVAALYIVSEDFPAARLGLLAAGALEREKQKTICAASHLPSSQLAQLKAYLDETVTVKSVLAGLHIRHIASLSELLRLFRDGTISAAFHSLGGTGIVVVDSIAGAAIAGVSDEGIASDEHGRDELLSDVVAVGVALKMFAVQEGAAVIVTNQVRSPLLPSGHQKRYAIDMVVPALGIQWSLVPHVRIHLRRLHGAPGAVYRQLTVLSGPAHPPVCGTYVIGSDGIRGDA